MPTIKQIIGSILLVESIVAFLAIFGDSWWEGFKGWNAIVACVVGVAGWVTLIIWLLV